MGGSLGTLSPEWCFDNGPDVTRPTLYLHTTLTHTHTLSLSHTHTHTPIVHIPEASFLRTIGFTNTRKTKSGGGDLNGLGGWDEIKLHCLAKIPSCAFLYSVWWGKIEIVNRDTVLERRGLLPSDFFGPEKPFL